MAGVVGRQDEWTINGTKSAQAFTRPAKLKGPLQQHQAALCDGAGAFDQWMVKRTFDVFDRGVWG